MSTAFESLDKGSIVTPRPRWAHIAGLVGARARGLCSRIHSHIRIVRPAAALGRNPGNILIRVLDIAGFAVDAVLRVDLQPRFAVFAHDFVNAGRSVALLGRVIEREVRLDRNFRVVEL